MLAYANEEQLELPGIIDYSKDKWEIKVEYENDPDSPRNWSNIGEICVSPRCKYTRDESGLGGDERLEWSSADADQKTLEDMGYVVLPLSVYDHSGVSIYIGGICDKWDSSQIGWYIASKEKICKEYGVKRISKKLLKKVIDVMTDEVKTYNHYINGEVYGFTLYHNGEEVDSCWGFYDYDDKYLGFLEDMYEHFPDEFRKAFTVEQAKELCDLPWQR